jgi:hypothetical protein
VQEPATPTTAQAKCVGWVLYHHHNVPYGKLILVEQFTGRESYMSIFVDMDGIEEGSISPRDSRHVVFAAAFMVNAQDNCCCFFYGLACYFCKEAEPSQSISQEEKLHRISQLQK